MIVTWNLAEKSVLFAGVVVEEASFRVVAEQLPRSSRWDWSVWRDAAQVRVARHGRANSREQARVAAECAVRDWNEMTERDEPER